MADDTSYDSSNYNDSSQFTSQSSQIHIHHPVPRRTFDAPAPITTTSTTSTATTATAAHDPTASPPHAYTTRTPPSALEPRRPSDFLAQLNARLLRTYNSGRDDDTETDLDRPPPTQSKSFLNLTGSTLLGIYDDVGATGVEERSADLSPWGTGAETPAHGEMGLLGRDGGVHGELDGGVRMKAVARRAGNCHTSSARSEGVLRRGSGVGDKSVRQGVWWYTVLGAKLAALFLFGLVYGIIVSHLHDSQQLAAVHIEGVDARGWWYMGSWGVFGVALGSLLPWVDVVWGAGPAAMEQRMEQKGNGRGRGKVAQEQSDQEVPISEQINDVVRSVCAFVGVAFAIRRLPWQSTLQLTITLALVNPALWYILDRSKPGLSFSLAVSSLLTSALFLANPRALPSPALPGHAWAANSTAVPISAPAAVAPGLVRGVVGVGLGRGERGGGWISYEDLAVVTWVGSVLFCSCVCFGSIGRRLAVLEEGRWRK